MSTARLSKIPRSVWVGLAVVVVLLAVATAFLWQPLSSLASNPENLKQSVKQAGWWGPLVFVGVQFLQILIAPIPGQVIGVAAGTLFGPFWGTIYSMIGALIGFTAIFMLSRRLGRPFVERFFKAEHLKKFDYLAKANGPLVFFLIFLLPAFPDDLVCYIAGLSAIPIRTLVAVSLAGRLPGYLVLALIGSGVAESNVTLIGVLVAVMAGCLVVAYWQRQRLEKWMRRLAKNQSNKD